MAEHIYLTYPGQGASIPSLAFQSSRILSFNGAFNDLHSFNSNAISFLSDDVAACLPVDISEIDRMIKGYYLGE